MITSGVIATTGGGSAHVFSAAIGREELLGRRLQDMAEKLCGGMMAPLLTHLVRARRLSARERQQLRSRVSSQSERQFHTSSCDCRR